MFLASIGICILINLGSNYFLGEISYITKALSAVLQLAVTMDYSIFLWHSYNEQRAHIAATTTRPWPWPSTKPLRPCVGSSITTIAGFIALCFMSFTLGTRPGHRHGQGRAAGRNRLRHRAALADSAVG